MNTNNDKEVIYNLRSRQIHKRNMFRCNITTYITPYKKRFGVNTLMKEYLQLNKKKSEETSSSPSKRRIES